MKTITSNQTKKIDRPYSMPIYLVHLTATWEYRGAESDSEVYYGSRLLMASESTSNWLTDRGGVKEGDNIELYASSATYTSTVKFIRDRNHIIVGNTVGPASWADAGDCATAVSELSAPYKIWRTLNLYLSDRNFHYNGIDYEDYLFDLSDIEEQIQDLGGYDNSSITLRFKNERIRDKNYLLELFDDYQIEGQNIEIYKLYHDSGETYASDVSTKIYKGVMGQPHDITDFEFSIDCNSMLFSKDDKLPFDVINETDYPYADPDDIGKHRNIIYGDCKRVVCPWTIAGWASTIVSWISETETSIVVSIAPTYVINTVVIDDEEIRITATSNNTVFSVVTRGYNGTTAVAHNKGAIIYEKRNYFEAEVAQHPVKAINNVYVKQTSEGEWLRVISGYTAYRNSNGRAYIRFTDKVKFDQSINITADTSVDEGSHGHNVSITGDISSETEITSYATSSSGPPGHSNAIDGNESSYCPLGKDQVLVAGFGGESDRGTITYTYVYIYKLDGGTSGYVSCTGFIGSPTLGAPPGWYRFAGPGGTWRSAVTITGGMYGNQIGEVYKVIKYIPYSDAYAEPHPATGVDVTVSLSGNSAANMVIGDIVAADVEGYEDATVVENYSNGKSYSCILTHVSSGTSRPGYGSDWETYWTYNGTADSVGEGIYWETNTKYYADGAFTGTANTLIERPDHVRKHILCSLLGFDLTDDIDGSFATVGTTYASQISGGYKLAFVMADVVTDSAMKLFREIDYQTRSNMFESAGKFYLHFNSFSTPSSALIFTKDNIRGFAKFGKTEFADVKNVFKGYFFRDYTKSGEIGEQYTKVVENEYASSIAQYGRRPEDVIFSCIGNLSDMASDVLLWIASEKTDIKKLVEIEAYWDADILQNCDYFYVRSNFWDNKLFKVTRWKQSFSDNMVFISGREYVITPFKPNRTVHCQSSTSPVIIEQGVIVGLTASHAITSTSPTIATRIGTPASGRHALTTTTATLTHVGSSLTIQNATMGQVATAVLMDSYSVSGIPEVMPHDYVWHDHTCTTIGSLEEH